MGTSSRFVFVLAAAAAAAGCVTYRGPHGVESAIERKAGLELHREIGFKLGPISTKLVKSFVHDGGLDRELEDVTGIGLAVFQVTGRTGAPVQPITAEDLGVEGWQPMFASRSEGDQVLVYGRAAGGEMREMMFVSMDGDEVVIARLKGHLDALIERTVATADRDGSASAALFSELRRE